MKTEKKLTAKQVRITEALAADYNIPEASEYLDMDTKALEGVVARAKDRLEVKHPGGLVAEAIRQGCIDLSKIKKRKR